MPKTIQITGTTGTVLGTYPADTYEGVFGMSITDDPDALLDIDVEEELAWNERVAEVLRMVGCDTGQIEQALAMLNDPDHWISRVSEALAN